MQSDSSISSKAKTNIIILDFTLTNTEVIQATIHERTDSKLHDDAYIRRIYESKPNILFYMVRDGIHHQFGLYKKMRQLVGEGKDLGIYKVLLWKNKGKS